MKYPSHSHHRGVTYIDVLVAIALILVLTATLLPAAGSMRETANRAKCAANLKQIGTAIKLYANENNGLWPRTMYDVKTADKPTAFTSPYAANPFKEGGPQSNDVTAAMFLLLRTEDLVSAVFTCPSTSARAWDYANAKTPQNASNWPEARYLSYSLMDPYPRADVANAGFKYVDSYLVASMPTAADGNPGGDELLRLTAKSSGRDMVQGNSRNHHREGQNVLYGDGHVEWSPTPFAGVNNDNIYTYGPSGQDNGGTGIVGAPTSKDDFVLLPVFEERKPVTRPATQPSLGLPRTPVAWDEEAVRKELALQPRDTYLQYVLMQLGRRADQDYADDVREITGGEQGGETPQVDLFGLFTGALAVQESLQLEAMRGQSAQPSPPASRPSAMHGPEVKSHPWKQMLAGRKPAVSKLSQFVPADFYLVECRSLSKLLDVLDSSNLWASRVASQSLGSAQDLGISERVMRQLAIRPEPILRPFYDTVVSEAAITGSDPFVREGSDVTLLFRLKQPEIFRARMASFLADAEKQTQGAKRSEGEILGVKYVSLASPDRRVNVYAADPSPDLHVRSNSRAALERVLRVIQGGGKDSLGTSSELKYVRTLMPPGAAEEDVFVYLSDPFIRRLVGPRVKIVERRRVICFSSLRMLASASMMFQTEYGRLPKSIEELKRGQCLPPEFGTETTRCPDGGTYSLSADGTCGVCSVHGHSDSMTPCIELPLKNVSPEEAQAYQEFVENYNQYWRHYFDPIAIRVQATPQQLRAETIILPLIDNSIYTSLSHFLGGKLAAQPALPMPDREIFNVGLRVNKDELLKDVPAESWTVGEDLFGDPGKELDVRKFVADGLGDGLAFHVCDAPQTFGLNMPEFFGEILPVAARGAGDFDEIALVIAPLIVSLNSPIYISVPVRDPKVVDGFLAKLDELLATDARGFESLGGFMRFERDFYHSGERRSHVLRLGPLTWRFCWERIGDGLYVASKPFILDDLKKAATAPAGEAASASARVRPQHFNAVLPEYQLAWAENDRRACLENQAWLSDAARALQATAKKEQPSDASLPDVSARASSLLASRFVCPAGGKYELAPDGVHVICSVHGSPLLPRQPVENPTQHPGTMYDMGEVTAALTFMEDGLRAVVTVQR